MNRTFGELHPEERGVLFEGLVAQVLRAYRDYRELFDDLHYWASGVSRTAVDFLLRRGRDLVAVEAKSGRQFAHTWCRGLRAVSELPGLKRRLIVYPTGPVLQTEDGIDVVPFEHFCQMLASDALWV